MIEIRPLDLHEYKEKKYIFKYETTGYYALIPSPLSFQFILKEYEGVKIKSFEDELVGDWLEKPVLFGAFKQNIMVGFIEGSMETWNNRFRISNVLVFEEYRNCQVGALLMEHMCSFAQKQKARMVILETQSCNVAAIGFYLHKGFKVIGFDTCSYTNFDIDNHHIRIEMGFEL